MRDRGGWREERVREGGRGGGERGGVGVRGQGQRGRGGGGGEGEGKNPPRTPGMVTKLRGAYCGVEKGSAISGSLNLDPSPQKKRANKEWFVWVFVGHQLVLELEAKMPRGQEERRGAGDSDDWSVS